MTIVQGRYGISRNYDVKMVGDTLPDDKIILILDGGYGYAYVVTDYKIMDRNKKTGEELYKYHISPIHKLDTQHGMPNAEWLTAEEMLTNEDYEVLFLDSLADIGKVESAYVYK